MRFRPKHCELVLTRLLLERAGVPVCVLGDEPMPNIGRAREVYRWMQYLLSRKDEFWSGGKLRKELRSHLGPWHLALPRGKMLEEVASEFYGETGGGEQRVLDIAEHFFEAIAERKRTGLGEGVALSTAHRAKGLEFDHVFILDGNWMPRTPTRGQSEEERRVYYVAMTRAKKTLTLFSRHDCQNGFLSEIAGPGVLERWVKTERTGADLLGIDCRTLTLDELWIDFAAKYSSQSPIGKALADLKEGDPVDFHLIGDPGEGDWMELRNAAGTAVARLSKRGLAKWRDHVAAVTEARVVGVHMRKASDGDGARNGQEPMREEWEIPIVEVCFRATPMQNGSKLSTAASNANRQC